METKKRYPCVFLGFAEGRRERSAVFGSAGVVVVVHSLMSVQSMQVHTYSLP